MYLCVPLIELVFHSSYIYTVITIHMAHCALNFGRTVSCRLQKTNDVAGLTAGRTGDGRVHVYSVTTYEQLNARDL